MRTLSFFILCTPILLCATTMSELFNNAYTAYKQGNVDLAISCYQRALQLDPNHTQTHFNLGLMFTRKNNLDTAIACHQRAIELDPNYTKAHESLGDIYMWQKKHEKAMPHYQKVIEQNPNNISVATQLGILYAMFDHLLKAEQLLKKVAQHQPKNTLVLYNLAYTLTKLNKRVEAVDYYQKTLEVDPNNHQARFGLAKALLALGEFEQGWKFFEHRFVHSGASDILKTIKPNDFKNQTVVIRAEWGLGDTIHFIRYAQQLKQLGARVVVETFEPLVKLFSLCDCIDEVILYGQKLPSVTYHIPLLSLPMIFNTTHETIPADIPYLQADKTLTKFWKRRLSHDKKFKIGICWHAKPIYLENLIHTRRSIPLTDFMPLMQMENVSVYSLQKVHGLEELQNISPGSIHVFNDLDEAHGPFMDTAALMKNLDLVISADTSIVHVDWALGVPVWVMLPHTAEWRWLMNKTDTPWYPNMRLFRQQEPGNWQAVMEEVTHEVKKLCAA